MRKKRFGFALITAVWLLPIILFLLFPYDIHGITEVNRVGYAIRDYYIYPGAALGFWISGLFQEPSTEVNAFWIIVGICIWLGVLSLLVYRMLCQENTIK